MKPALDRIELLQRGSTQITKVDQVDHGEEKAKQESAEEKGQDPVGVHGDVLCRRERGSDEGDDTKQSEANKKANGEKTRAGGTTESRVSERVRM